MDFVETFVEKVFDFDRMCAYGVYFERTARYFMARLSGKNRESLPSYVGWEFLGVFFFIISYYVARNFRVRGELGFAEGR